MLVKVEELARFLTSGSRTAADVGKFLAEVTYKDFDLISVYFFRADNDGKVRFAGGHNIPVESSEKWPEFDLNLPLPLTECVRNRQKIWLNGREEWELQYPDRKSVV